MITIFYFSCLQIVPILTGLFDCPLSRKKLPRCFISVLLLFSFFVALMYFVLLADKYWLLTITGV